MEEDLQNIGAQIINTYRQHRWSSDLGNWTYTLEGLTPRTWNHLEDVPDSAFPVVLKGETNSKKFQWDSLMFAPDRPAASDIWYHLQEDGLIEHQSIFVRQYVPLKRYLTGFRGLPISKEFRVFVCHGQELSRGYYWTNYLEDLPERPDPSEIPQDFLAEVLGRVGNNCTFYAVDVAQTEAGDWTVIDLGDAQMCGLSDNDPAILYSRLRDVLAPSRFLVDSHL